MKQKPAEEEEKATTGQLQAAAAAEVAAVSESVFTSVYLVRYFLVNNLWYTH